MSANRKTKNEKESSVGKGTLAEMNDDKSPDNKCIKSEVAKEKGVLGTMNGEDSIPNK